METSELRNRLSGLHELLAHSPAVDDESRQLLRTLLHDIEQVLEQSPTGEALPARTHGHRLEQLAAHFEADHPSLAGVLRQVVDVLGKAGI